MFHAAKAAPTDQPLQGAYSRRPYVIVTVGVLGAGAVIIQLALMRELLAVFSANELTFGITLSCWLVLTAGGTWLGALVRHIPHPVRHLVGGTALLGVVALAEGLAIRSLRGGVFGAGETIDPLGTTYGTLLVLAPFCLGSGMLLTFGCRILFRENEGHPVARVYLADVAGAVLGAVLFTVWLGRGIDHMTLLAWLAAGLCAFAAGISRRTWGHRFRLVAAAGAVVLAALAWFGDLATRSTQWQYPALVVDHRTTPYGRVVVTRDAGQLALYENGVPVSFSANAAAAEEIVHYALAQRPGARSVLLVGGGVAGAAPEVLRHPTIQQVTCVELDPGLLMAAREHLPNAFADARIRVVAADGRRFLQQTAERFDVILIALPDPTTLQLNRLFTAEFFALAKRALHPAGVFAFGTGYYVNYISPELAATLGSARATLATAFSHVAVLPGARVFFLGSDGPLHRDIAPALEQLGVAPRLVNRHYLAATLAPDRLADVDRASLTPAPINTDFRPILYVLRLRQWLSQFSFPAGAFGGTLVLVFVTALVRLPAIPRLVFAAGYAASTLELALLVTLQVCYGSLYQQIGLVTALFMAGLALGAAFARRHPSGHLRRLVRTGGFALGALALVCALLLPRLGAIDAATGTPGGYTVLLGLTLLISGVVGAQFAYAAAQPTGNAARQAPRIFSADLVGAALGALTVSSFMLPEWGLVPVCLFAAALNLACAAVARPSR
ncbi:fused MFS/spermidine synthase [Opitutus sp. ER46]|uniref:fused MFS/spermidine synthase n=1 Tax=Opitutus sp. ER46 TaxID=2161864 RepID=UPI000D321CB6|nr:fused MFS/spermidine synthase [Opitutus sp. ER46]PTX92572.1 hypothetical protein DB354_14685 [Opitutus sp. ER46]